MKEQITAGLAALGLLDKVPACAPEQLERYGQMLLEKNQVMNLTAITEYEEVVQKHFVDSLSIVKVCDMKQVQTLIDVGTGAGFRGGTDQDCVSAYQSSSAGFAKQACTVLK